MTTPTTVDLDTELSAVNAILGAIGQAPVASLGTANSSNNPAQFDNPEIAFIYNLLKESNLDIQNEGWTFNKEEHIKYANKSGDKFTIDADIIQIDYEDAWDRTRDFVRRKDSDGVWKIYDRVNHTFEFPDDDYFYVNVIRRLKFEDIPAPFQRYIIYKASGRAAVELVANPALQKSLASFEAQARAACMEYECNQGDHSYFGWPDDSAYKPYKPYISLRR